MRETNQDRVLTVEHKDMFLGLVCDGIGGAKAGDVASEMTIELFRDAFQRLEKFESFDAIIEWFHDTVELINLKVYQKSRSDTSYRGMGTTCIGVVIQKGRALAFNIGDSRIYDYRHQKLNLLSHDQTYPYMMYLENQISMDEVENHPQRNVLMNAIGIKDKITFETIRIPDGWDRLLLCSDGLHGYVPLNEIEATFEFEIQKTADTLIELAYEAGGFDNVSIIVVEGEGYE